MLDSFTRHSSLVTRPKGHNISETSLSAMLKSPGSGADPGVVHETNANILTIHFLVKKDLLNNNNN